MYLPPNSILPVAEDVVGRMPPFVLIGAAEPGKPPVDHLGPAARHSRQRGDDFFSIVEIGISRFERQISRCEKIVGLMDIHHCDAPLTWRLENMAFRKMLR